jgi:hypothetical protein
MEKDLEMLQILRERLESKYPTADLEILGPEPNILYLHMNDAYDHTLALTKEKEGFVLIDLQHLRSETFKSRSNWTEAIETSDIQDLEDFVDKGYERIIRSVGEFEQECREVLSAFMPKDVCDWS